MLGIGLNIVRTAARNMVANITAAAQSLYRQPDGTSKYLQPDGTSKYLIPE